MKKLLIILATCGLVFQISACKSKKPMDDAEIVENADVEKIDAEDANITTQDQSAGPVDESLQAALGESSTSQPQNDQTAVAAAPETAVTESIETSNPQIAETPVLDESSLTTPAPQVADSSTPPVEVTTDTQLQPTTEVANTATTSEITETPVTETAPAVAQNSMAEITETPIAEKTETHSEIGMGTVAEEKVSTPAASGSILRKIAETTPYQHGDGWVNTVYIVHPKENLAQISKTIYGNETKTKELKALNTYLKSRSPKAGDKVYYISPNRPTDSSKTISYYEDVGMIPETYVAKSGDNLKKVAKQLLGYDRAYVEMWTTNPVESKDLLKDGETLRYWKSSSSVATEVASHKANLIESQNQLPQSSGAVAQNAPPPEPQAAVQPPAQQELPPPPPVPDQAVNAQPPQAEQQMPAQPAADIAQQSAQEVAQQQMQPQAELPPPPPPPPAEVAPAPTTKMVEPNMEEESSSQGMNSDTMMMLGGVVILTALLALVLIRRNKRKKEAEMSSFSETNVGT